MDYIGLLFMVLEEWWGVFIGIDIYFEFGVVFFVIVENVLNIIKIKIEI